MKHCQSIETRRALDSAVNSKAGLDNDIAFYLRGLVLTTLYRTRK